MYIRLAAFLAGQPADVRSVSLTIREIEGLLGEPLPRIARFPSWWRNDERKMHSRAWITAGWEVSEVEGPDGLVRFSRTGEDSHT